MLDGAGCRPAAVRRYFGETNVEPCGQCDLCLNPPLTRDMTTAAQKALSAAQRLGGRYGRGRLIDHLLGKTKDVSAYEAGLTTYGIGQELSLQQWRDLTDQLLFDGLLREDANDGRPLIGLGDALAVKAVYRGETRVQMRDRPAAPDKTGKARGDLEISAADRPLFEALRAWRKAQAAAQGVPPYVIFGDRTLAAIAAARPRSLETLQDLNGVGQVKLDRYGADVLAVLASVLTQAA
jgi:ATP-dependent DNA helicase RecQ